MFDSIFSVCYMPVTKAKSSSSALQQHAVLSVKRDHRLKCFLKCLCLKELALMEGLHHLVQMFQRPFHPSIKILHIYMYKYIYTYILGETLD